MGVGLLRLASFLALIASVSPAVQTSKGITFLLLNNYSDFSTLLQNFFKLLHEILTSFSCTGQQTNGDFKFANFKVHNGAYLNITSVGTDLVQRTSHCAFACVNKEPCFSFNLAAFPDINNKLLCELLPSDKYINSDKFISNKLYYHYSIPVRLFLIITIFWKKKLLVRSLVV